MPWICGAISRMPEKVAGKRAAVSFGDAADRPGFGKTGPMTGKRDRDGGANCKRRSGAKLDPSCPGKHTPLGFQGRDRSIHAKACFMRQIARHLTACVLVLGSAWAWNAHAQIVNQTGAIGQSTPGTGGIGSSDATTSRLDSETAGSRSTLYPLTEEVRTFAARTAPAGGKAAEKDGATSDPTGTSGTSSDRHVKRQGYLRLKTMRIHPQPNLRHATGTYRPRRQHDTAAASAIHEALGKPLHKPLVFHEASLMDLKHALADQAGIPIVFDMKALEAFDLLEATITESASDTLLRSALRRILRQFDLTYLVQDEALVITTNDAAQANPVIRLYPLAAWSDAQDLANTIQSTFAPATWDANGGPGAIRVLIEGNTLVISQTEEVHEDITAFLSHLCDGDLEPPDAGAPTNPASIPTRIHPVRDEKTLSDLQQKLVPLCNAALGTDGDPDAKVNVVAGRLVVQSRKRSFHVYAAEIIRAIDGVDATVPEYFGVSGANTTHGYPIPGINMLGPGVLGDGVGGGDPFGGFCWIAREVYGANDPRWLAFRTWMLTEAPAWLRRLYATVGPDVATWIRTRPLARAALRTVMDTVVEPRPMP